MAAFQTSKSLFYVFISAAIFALIGGAVTSNTITITEHSLNQEKTINMYTDGAKVDLTAGVNITVKCLADGVDDSDMLLRFPTNQYAKVCQTKIITPNLTPYS